MNSIKEIIIKHKNIFNSVPKSQPGLINNLEHNVKKLRTTLVLASCNHGPFKKDFPVRQLSPGLQLIFESGQLGKYGLHDNEITSLIGLIKLVPDYRIDPVNFIFGTTTSEGLDWYNAALNKVKQSAFCCSDPDTLKLALYHTRMVRKSLGLLGKYSFADLSSGKLNEILLEIRRDIFWHRWYIHEKVNKIGGNDLRLWIGLNNLWDSEPIIQGFYDGLCNDYMSVLQRVHKVDSIGFTSLAFILALTAIPSNLKVSSLSHLSIMESALIFKGVLPATIGFTQKIKSHRVGNHQLTNIKRQMDCFRIFDKMIYFTLLKCPCSVNLLSKSGFDYKENVDEPIVYDTLC